MTTTRAEALFCLKPIWCMQPGCPSLPVEFTKAKCLVTTDVIQYVGVCAQHAQRLFFDPEWESLTGVRERGGLSVSGMMHTEKK